MINLLDDPDKRKLRLGSHDNKYTTFKRSIIQNDLFKNISKPGEYQNEICCNF